MLTFSKLKKSFSPCSCGIIRRTLNNYLRSFSVASDLQGLRFCIWVALKFDTFTDEPYNLVSTILAHSVRALVRSYSSLGLTNNAIKVFDQMPELGVIPDAHMYNTILRDVLKKQLFELALALYTTMIKSNVVPDHYTYNMLIDGFSKSGDIAGAYEMIYEMQKVNLTPNVLAYTYVLYGSCQAKNVDEARKVFNDMEILKCPPDVVSCNVLLNGYCQMGRAGRYSEAHAWYTRMFKEGIPPDVVTYGMVDEAQELFHQIKEFGSVPSAVTFNVLINGLCKAHRLEEAINLFSIIKMRQDPGLQENVEQMYKDEQFLNAYEFLTLTNSRVNPDIITYNILINACCEARNIEDAKKLFKELRKNGLSPDCVTYGTLIKGLYMIDKKEEAFNLFGDMQKVGCEPTLSVYRTVMTWLCKNREVLPALKLYLKYLKSLPSRDNDSISVLEEYIDGGKLEPAIRGLLELDDRTARDFKLAPYTILLIGFCQAKKVNEAYIVFSVLHKFNIKINATSCVHLIKGLCDEHMMYNLIDKAQAQDKSYISAPDAVSDKHCLTAHELFDGNDLAIFLSNLHQEVTNLKAMLHAIDIEWDFLQMDGHKGSPRRKSYPCPSNGWTEQRLIKWYSLSPSKQLFMGALFRACQVISWTDVDGVYSTDPRKAMILKTLESCTLESVKAYCDLKIKEINFHTASSEQSVCFSVPEKEVKAVSEVLQSIFHSTLYAGRLSQLPTPISSSDQL
ncbi:hypothetical protein TSUD_103970 [Trifolium subterraneum]|uniref:Pentatricopeptide repeat-containing protein n=1 Tax=Trifolium subterraneum TaxID=3900 RepID=A0A2Z6M6V5_TRISU|nr:hypothetical protein TSUD_103970 [Trifolium subterraneum]